MWNAVDIIAFIASLKDEDIEFGPLHIFLADGNVDDGDIEFCRQEAILKLDGTAERVATALLLLTEAERKNVYENWRDACPWQDYRKNWPK